MPDNLLDVHLRHFSFDKEFPCSQSRSQEILGKMLQAVRVNASSFRSTSRPPTATAFLQYKNKTKCRLLLNARAINAADRRSPPWISLPSLRDFSDRLGKPGGKGLWMAKLDLTNAGSRVYAHMPALLFVLPSLNFHPPTHPGPVLVHTHAVRVSHNLVLDVLRNSC